MDATLVPKGGTMLSTLVIIVSIFASLFFPAFYFARIWLRCFKDVNQMIHKIDRERLIRLMQVDNLIQLEKIFKEEPSPSNIVVMNMVGHRKYRGLVDNIVQDYIIIANAQCKNLRRIRFQDVLLHFSVIFSFTNLYFADVDISKWASVPLFISSIIIIGLVALGYIIRHRVADDWKESTDNIAELVNAVCDMKV